MEAEYIKVAPFQFKQIISASFEKAVNDHGMGYISGYIDLKDEELYTAYPVSKTPVIVSTVSEEGEEKIFYYGVLESLNISHKNSQLLMEIQIVPYTKLMDLSPRMRSFQNEKTTYRDVITMVFSRYEVPGVIMEPGIAETFINEYLVQYQETDWEFIKRLASHFNRVVIPDYMTDGVKFYFGIPQRAVSADISNTEYRLEKSLTTYNYKMENGVTGTSEYDDMAVKIPSRSLYDVGDKVLFEGRPYIVAHSISALDGHQLNHLYTLVTENGLKIPKQYNEKMIGASIDGIVMNVAADEVQVQLGVEDEQVSRWFAYATVFSSTDGSGWYFMPQKGDEIRLYFPTRREKHAYAVSSVHRPITSSNAPAGTDTVVIVEKEAPRSNPLTNEISTPDGKRVRFTETSIIMETPSGMRFTMTDGEGISIVSSGSVSIRASENLNIAGSKTLFATAGVRLRAYANGSSVTLDSESVTISGKNVFVQ